MQTTKGSTFAAVGMCSAGARGTIRVRQESGDTPFPSEQREKRPSERMVSSFVLAHIGCCIARWHFSGRFRRCAGASAEKISCRKKGHGRNRVLLLC